MNNYKEILEKQLEELDCVYPKQEDLCLGMSCPSIPDRTLPTRERNIVFDECNGCIGCLTRVEMQNLCDGDVYTDNIYKHKNNIRQVIAKLVLLN